MSEIRPLCVNARRALTTYACFMICLAVIRIVRLVEDAGHIHRVYLPPTGDRGACFVLRLSIPSTSSPYFTFLLLFGFISFVISVAHIIFFTQVSRLW